MIAAHHLTILRKIYGDKYRWIIKNNLDTSGFWIRTRRVDLRDGTEFLAGTNKFRFKEGRALDPSLQQVLIHRLESGSLRRSTAFEFENGSFLVTPSVRTKPTNTERCSMRLRSLIQTARMKTTNRLLGRLKRHLANDGSLA